MAFGINIASDYGIPATYFNIGSVQEDFKGKGTSVTLYGYSNQKAREDGLQPLSVVQVTLAGEDYIPDANRAQLYAKLKAIRPEFADATEV